MRTDLENKHVGRRTFVKLAAGAAAATAASDTQRVSADTDTATLQPESITDGPPSAVAPVDDAIEIIWRVNGLCKGFVQYGLTRDLGKTQTFNSWGMAPMGSDTLRIRLRGLKPGTTYYYRVVTQSIDLKRSETSDIRSFTTLNSKGDDTQFVMWNDTHRYNDTIKRLVERVPERCDVIVWNGDNACDAHQPGEVSKALYNPSKDIDITAKSPLMLVRGNHEMRGEYIYELEQCFPTPDPQGNTWYAFRSGPVACIVLDTGEDKSDSSKWILQRSFSQPMREIQAEWLKEVTQKPGIKDAPYRIVFCHIPLHFSKEDSRHAGYYCPHSRKLWQDTLLKWKTQAILSGHTHEIIDMKPTQNRPYYQFIGGGPKLGGGSTGATFHKIAADKDRMRITTHYAIYPDGAEYDFKPLG